MVEEVELSIGDIAPGFECTITNGEKINLSEIISQGEGVILYFYPRDNTPGCTIEACDFRDNFSRFKETGWKVKPERRLGFFHRYVYMPEFDQWAHKVSQIHFCRGIYPVSLPTEEGHRPILERPERAAMLVESPGDKFFINQFFRLW